MVPVLEPAVFTTLSMLKNAINSAVPREPGRIPVVTPDADTPVTVAVWPVLVRSGSVK